MPSPEWGQKETQLSNVTLPSIPTSRPSPNTPTGGPRPTALTGGPLPTAPTGGPPPTPTTGRPPPIALTGGPPPIAPTGGPPPTTALGGPPPTAPISGPHPTPPICGPTSTTPTGGPPLYLPVSKSGPGMATPVVSSPGLMTVNGVRDDNAKEPPQTRLANPISYVRPEFSYQLLPTPNNNPSSSHHSVSDMAMPPVSNDSTQNNPRASFQPTAVGMNASVDSFPPGSSVVIQPPKLPSTESAAFSFTGSVELVHKDQPVKSNDSASVTGPTSSMVSSSPSSSSMVQNTSNTAITSASAPNCPASWAPPARKFEGTVALPETSRPPGLHPLPQPHLFRTPSAPPEPSSLFRPTSLPPNPLPYTPLAAMAPPHPGLWLHPPQPSGIPRPPFLQYPTIVPPPSFQLPNHGMPFPPVPVLDPKHSGGLILPGNVSGSTQSAYDSASRLPGYISPEVLPPGIDYRKKPSDGDGSKQAASVSVDVWTVHKADSGVDYYYNSTTGESTYVRPSGFNGRGTNKGATKPTPVSWEKVTGMDWVSVSTNDGREYYHNSKTKLSCWEIPPEVADVRKKQNVVTSKELNDDSVTYRIPMAGADKGNQFNSSSVVYRNPGDSATVRPTGAVIMSTALDLIKKKLQDPGAPAAVAISPGSGPGQINGSRVGEATCKVVQGENRQKAVGGDANASDVSSDSENEDAGRTKEELVVQFKEMLKDRGVAPFSKWHKELPKIVFDPRFKAVRGYSARRSLFEHFVKTRAEEERKEKRAAQKASTEEFKQLLEAASNDIDHSTDYHAFKKKWGNDSRFFAVERKEREHLLNERTLPLKKAEEEKAQTIRVAATSSFKSLLQEKGDITLHSRWYKVKEKIRGDTRYKAVRHEDREALFDEHISEIKAVSEEADRPVKARKEEEERRKERERELRKRKERDEQEMERVRLKVQRKDAIVSYQALLVEKIKDPLSSWTESKPKLDKDPQGRATNSELEPSDMEKLFRDHVRSLNERCAQEYKALLSEVLTAEAGKVESEDGRTALSSWSTAKELLRADGRYGRMPRDGREHLWLRYTEEMQRKVKRAEDDGEAVEPREPDSSRSAPKSRRNHDPRWLLIRQA